MQPATWIALAGLGLTLLINVVGWARFIGSTSERLKRLDELVQKMELAWKYISQLDRRVAVLEDRDARAEAGD